MISAALFLALQVAPYHALPSVDRESIERCKAAAYVLHKDVTNFQTFVTAHEKDNGGRLNSEEAVVYRAMADDVTRPFRDEISFLQEGYNTGAKCEQLAEQGKWALVNEVSGPLFGPYYSYSRQPDGGWRRDPNAGPIPRKN